MRELRNVADRFVLGLRTGSLTQFHPGGASLPQALPQQVRSFGRSVIVESLRLHRGDQAAAALKLCIPGQRCLTSCASSTSQPRVSSDPVARRRMRCGNAFQRRSMLCSMRDVDVDVSGAFCSEAHARELDMHSVARDRCKRWPPRKPRLTHG